MESKAAIAGHPLHPLLVLVPAGAFLITLVLDVGYLISGATLWWVATLPVIVIGVLGGLVAAVPGVIDLVTVAPHRNATRIGVTHMVLNLVVVALFAVNGWLRWTATLPPEAGQPYLGFWLTLIGAVLLLVSGWLGNSMVYRYHVGVVEPRPAGGAEAGERRRRGEAA